MAQKAFNNPPFGYKFLGNVADDITELFSLTSISGTSITASNGLTKVGDDVQLGGTLSSNVSIDSDGNQFNLTNTSNYFLSTAVDGKLGTLKLGFGFDANTSFDNPEGITPLVDDYGVVADRTQLVQSNGIGFAYVKLIDGGIEIFGGAGTVSMQGTNILLAGLPTYADDTAAGSGGLSTNMVYKTATGELRIKL